MNILAGILNQKGKHKINMNELEEIWKPVVGYEGRYEISNLGRVKSLARTMNHYRATSGKAYIEERFLRLLSGGKRNRKLKFLAYGGGNGQKRLLYVHQQVMYAFIGTRPSGAVIRHLDGNDQNNCLDNLCYGTSSENARDRVLHGTDARGSKSAMAKLTEMDVLEIFRLKWYGRTPAEIAPKFNVCKDAIKGILDPYSNDWGWFKKHIKLGAFPSACGYYLKPRKVKK